MVADLVDVDDRPEPSPKRERRSSEGSTSDNDANAQACNDGCKSPGSPEHGSALSGHTSAGSPGGHKPRIWSIVDTATVESHKLSDRSPQSSPPPPPPVALNSLIADRLFGAHAAAAALQQKQWYAALAQNAAAHAHAHAQRAQSPAASTASSTS